MKHKTTANKWVLSHRKNSPYMYPPTMIPALPPIGAVNIRSLENAAVKGAWGYLHSVYMAGKLNEEETAAYERHLQQQEKNNGT